LNIWNTGKHLFHKKYPFDNFVLFLLATFKCPLIIQETGFIKTFFILKKEKNFYFEPSLK
jgi:hypothetical protein